METPDCPPPSLFCFFQSRSYCLVWLPVCMLLPSIPGLVCRHVTKFKRLSGVVDVRHALLGWWWKALEPPPPRSLSNSYKLEHREACSSASAKGKAKGMVKKQDGKNLPTRNAHLRRCLRNRLCSGGYGGALSGTAPASGRAEAEWQWSEMRGLSWPSRELWS